MADVAHCCLINNAFNFEINSTGLRNLSDTCLHNTNITSWLSLDVTGCHWMSLDVICLSSFYRMMEGWWFLTERGGGIYRAGSLPRLRGERNPRVPSDLAGSGTPSQHSATNRARRFGHPVNPASHLDMRFNEQIIPKIQLGYPHKWPQ